jgi:enoyl-CoA hydratase/carnithine racemase
MAGSHAAADGEALLAELNALGAGRAEVVVLPDRPETPRPDPGVVRIGVQPGAPSPGIDPEAFDILICEDPRAPAPWVGLPPGGLQPTLDALVRQVARHPVAAVTAAEVLRASPKLAFDEALRMESLAYSMLLASEDFLAWRRAHPARPRRRDDGARVRVDQEGPAIALRLNRPAARNAFDAAMRDALAEALAFALEHPDRPPVILSGEGPAFSAGGDLDEFGTARDVGLAHLIRTLRSPARLVHALGERLSVRLHGACVGAGIEVPAAAARVTAAGGAFFRLPEVSMGLIPGAGGAASLPRRIGRHRAAYMAISGADIDVPTALAWGLVDSVE